MTQDIYAYLQIILSIILIALILLQAKGTGLGSTFGGEMGFYRTKRGAEKILFYLTIVVSVLFFITSFIRIVL